MEDVCPLCGRLKKGDEWESFIPNDYTEIENQINNLDRALIDLRSEQGSLLRLAENRIEMCPLCTEIMDGIENESDRDQLIIRINEKVEQLEEKTEDMLPGKE